jgi:hypothetical protein
MSDLVDHAICQKTLHTDSDGPVSESGKICYLDLKLHSVPSASMRWLSKYNFLTPKGTEYHPLCFIADTALETQHSYQHVLCFCTKSNFLPSGEGPH